MRAGLWIAVLGACGGGQTSGGASSPPMGKMDSMMVEGTQLHADEASQFGPLDVGADWATYTRVNTAPFRSETHGNRMVDVFVNGAGLEAYQTSGTLPVGSVVVKTSKQDDGSDGPVFVMEKRTAGFDAEHGDWSFAIHWADPPAAWKQRLGGPIYWRTPSKKAAYCVECHDTYDDHDYMGGVPEAQRAW